MTENEIRSVIKENKEKFRRIQAQLPFAEKVRIAFELNKRRISIKQGKVLSAYVDPEPTKR